MFRYPNLRSCNWTEGNTLRRFPGIGEKYLSRGYVPNVPVVTAGLTVKVGLTVTHLLHEVDLVLGVNWLQLVNPVVDWSGARLCAQCNPHRFTTG